MNTSIASHAEVSEETAQEDQHQYLTFRVRDDNFAVGILSVKEILEYGLVTTVPLMPAFVRGVINLRGRVVPVIDLAMRLSGCRTEPTPRTCIIIAEVKIEDERLDIGIIVDAVSQVLEIAPGEIEPAPTFGGELRSRCIAGMGKLEGRLVIILKLEHMLSVEEIASAFSASQLPSDS